jgi:hypothetical protein
VWCAFDHWVGDKLVEQWAYNDFLTMLLQQGVVTLPKPAAK